VTGGSFANFDGGDELFAGTKLTITETVAGAVDFAAGYSAGATSIVIDTLTLNDDFAAGSILSISAAVTGSTEQNYVITEAVSLGGSQEATFTFTPPLRTALSNDDAVSIIRSSRHVTTANHTFGGGAAAGTLTNLPIYPDLPSDYNAATVTIEDAIIDDAGRVTAYNDAFGLNTGEYATGDSSAATITVSGSTMTIVASDTQDAGDGDAANDGGAIDMSGFFDDLSHNDAQSVLGLNEVDANGNAVSPAVVPDLLASYEDVQDTNFNSWSKVENYDRYDDSGEPQLVGADGLEPKVRVKDTIDGINGVGGEIARAVTAYDSDRTFLYAVTGPTLVGAHGNLDTGANDDDVIFTPADALTTMSSILNDTDADITLAGTAVDDDYPLFALWGINTSTAGTPTNRVVTAGTRVVLTLDSEVTAVANQTRAYIYHPEDTNAASDVADGAFDPTQIITPVIASGLGGATIATNTAGTVAASGTAIVLDMPAYEATAGDMEETDQLVIEDIEINNQLYTLIVDIPTFSTAQESAAMSDATNPPNYQFYKKVVLDGSVVNNDTTRGTVTAGTVPNFDELQTGGTIHQNYISVNVVVPYREVVTAGTPSWSIGTIQEGSTTVTSLADFTATAEVEADGDQGDSDVNVVLTYNSEGGTYVGHEATLDVPVTDLSGNTNTTRFTFRAGHGATEDIDGAGGAGVGAIDYPIILNLISNTNGNSVD